ncbi:MAG: response regulator transcription factor [Woeseiaceae bacterium]
MPKKKILIIEDHMDLANVLILNLSDLDYTVKHAADGLKGLNYIENESFDLVILDLMLPGMDGLEICRRIRNQNNYTPVLMLTSRSSEIDRVLGLEIGADDYVTKPFSVREVMARIKALFRRIEAFSNTKNEEQELQHIVSGNLNVDINNHNVSIDGQYIDLTAREFDLLCHFMQRPGRVYSRAQLLDMVWGYGHEGYEHTVNSHINRLRAKIESDPANPNYILTIWGVGYKFNESLSAA